MTELLAPAGSVECFNAAINFGADAVYLGLGGFSARKDSGFFLEQLPGLIKRAHLFGVKVYAAVNTLIKDGELDEFEDIIAAAHNMGVDAFILQDIFLGKLIKDRYPEIKLHLSTQAGVNNSAGARMARGFGFERVILARETGLKQIEKISKIIETECFIQGALCTSFSGHCYMSAFAGGNSGNRGLCRQPCRREYRYEGDLNYALSLSDLNLGQDIKSLEDAGVSSLKIEGRLRRPEYVAAAVSYYREVLSGGKGNMEGLLKTFNRGDYTKGYIFGQDKKLISKDIQSHKGQLIGTVERVEGNRVFIRSRHTIAAGDGFKIISNGKETGSLNGNNAKPADFGFTSPFKGKAEIGDKVHITTDEAFNKKLLSFERKIPVKMTAELSERLTLKVMSGGIYSEGSVITTEAKTSPLTKKELKEQLTKAGDTPFEVAEIEIIKNGNRFLRKSEINALRRECLEGLSDKLIESNFKNRPLAPQDTPLSRAYLKREEEHGNSYALISNRFDFDLTAFDKFIFAPTDYENPDEYGSFFENIGKRGEKYLYLPPFLPDKDLEIIYPKIKGFDGIYCDGYYGLELSKYLKKELFAGVEFNIFNSAAAGGLKSLGIQKYCLSKEMSLREIDAAQAAGYVLSLGGIKVMSLMYCPFNKECSSCKRGDLFTLTDYAGRVFFVRRYHLGGCRFEVYNPDFLLPKEDFKGNRLADFTVFNKKTAEAAAGNMGDRTKLKEILINTTSGSLIRGVN